MVMETVFGQRGILNNGIASQDFGAVNAYAKPETVYSRLE